MIRRDLETTTRGQFHQPYGAKHKMRRYSLCGAIQFHQQNYFHLYYAQLRNMLNFFAICSAQCVIEIGVNLLAQKPIVENLWN